MDSAYSCFSIISIRFRSYLFFFRLLFDWNRARRCSWLFIFDFFFHASWQSSIINFWGGFWLICCISLEHIYCTSSVLEVIHKLIDSFWPRIFQYLNSVKLLIINFVLLYVNQFSLSEESLQIKILGLSITTRLLHNKIIYHILVVDIIVIFSEIVIRFQSNRWKSIISWFMASRVGTLSQTLS